MQKDSTSAIPLVLCRVLTEALPSSTDAPVTVSEAVETSAPHEHDGRGIMHAMRCRLAELRDTHGDAQMLHQFISDVFKDGRYVRMSCSQ